MKLALKLLLGAALLACLASAASAAFGPDHAVRLLKAAHAKLSRASRAHGVDPLLGVVDSQLLRMSKGCATASNPETCVERCFRPLASFSEPRCFPENPFTSIGDDDDDDDTDTDVDVDVDFDTDVDGPSSSSEDDGPDLFALTDEASIDRFCECKGAYLRLMRTFGAAIRCLTGESINIEPLINFLDRAFTFTCTKNGDRYCFELFQDAGEFENIDNFGADNSTCADNSEVLDYLGCCVRTTHDFIKNTDFEALGELDFGGDDDDDDDDDDIDFDSGDDDDDEETVLASRPVRPADHDEDHAGDELLDGDIGFEVFENALASCDKTIRDVTACLAPGQSAVYTVVTATLDIDYAVLSANATVMRAFRLAFVRDVAAALDVSPLAVSIVSVSSGSTVVDFRVRSSEASLDEVSAALSTGISLTRVNDQLGSSITLDSSSASAKTETVKAAAINPASVAAPTFAVFALSALVALLL